MYETLTIFLKKFDAIENGESQSTLDEIVPEFMEAVSTFVDTHQDWELHTFPTILDIARDDFFVNNLFSLKLSALNGKTVVALILDSIKNCHTGDEVFMAPFEDGRIIKCLNRLNPFCAEARRQRKCHRRQSGNGGAVGQGRIGGRCGSSVYGSASGS